MLLSPLSPPPPFSRHVERIGEGEKLVLYVLHGGTVHSEGFRGSLVTVRYESCSTSVDGEDARGRPRLGKEREVIGLTGMKEGLGKGGQRRNRNKLP